MAFLKTPLLFTLFFLILFSKTALSAPVYPGTQWSSDRVKESLIGIRVGSVIGGEKNVVTLSCNHLTVYALEGGTLVKRGEVSIPKPFCGLRLSLADYDSDGVSEMVVSGLKRDQALTQIWKINLNKINKIGDLDLYISSITWSGSEALIGQNKLGSDDFSGPIFKVEGGKKSTDLGLKTKLDGDAWSLFSIQGLNLPDRPPGLLYLNKLNQFAYYESQGGSWAKNWKSSQEYGGKIYHVDLETRNALNQVEGRRFFVPVSFKVDGNQVWVMKNDGYLKDVIGAVPSIKNSLMTRLVWSGYGFQENWNSPRFDGAISDFDLIDWDGDGTNEVIVAFWLRDKGYVDTLKNQDSLLMVIDVP